MSNRSPAARQQIARPLKVLIPLIQSELQQGNDAGHDHYRRAGEMLIEAKEQVTYGSWQQWLTKNFDLSKTTANVYMRWAREHLDGRPVQASLHQMTGGTDRRREQRQSTQQQAFRRVLRDVAADTFVQERQTQDEEIRICREMAEELIDIGYRGMATKVHPDVGGSKVAMTRLNRIRDELKQIAQTRRFV